MNGNNGLKFTCEDKIRLVEKFLKQEQQYPYMTKNMFSINIGMSKSTFCRWVREYKEGKYNRSND